MKAICRRLGKLEESIAPPIESFEMKRLRERLEAARKRMVTFGSDRHETVAQTYSRDWGIAEILQEGRQRVRLRATV